jgi:hypothetical protein
MLRPESWSTDGPRQGGAAGREDRAGAGVRGGFPAVFVRVPAEAVGGDGDGTAANRFIAGCQFVEDWFNGHGLYRLRGTIRYPKAA